MKLTYIKQGAEPVGDGGDQYTGLDRFGRVVDQRWIKNNGTALERVDYGYSRASNRQWRWNRVAAGGQDEYYNYDGLYQVKELQRGTLNSAKTSISGTPTWEEDFTYDPIGNWNGYLTKVSGVTDLDQERTHNQANETTEIDGSSTTVAHDPAGNMVAVPQVGDWEAANGLKWDAWNRLVEVVEGDTTVAQYRYDGLTRRATKTTDATRHYYYSDQWQIMEERVDAETAADRQFVWGQRYIDDLVLRDRDADHDGSLEERLYVLHDYFNPTAVAAPNGTVLERYGYDAFGLSRVMTAGFNPRAASSYDWEARYGAYRWDAETGFYQVRFRYLHPTLDRWLSRDPIGRKGGVNYFAYALNNAVNSIDLFGLKVSPTIGSLLLDCSKKLFEKKVTSTYDKAAVCNELAQRIRGTTKPRPGEQDAIDIDLDKGFTFSPYWEPTYTPSTLSQDLKQCLLDAVKGKGIEELIKDVADPIKKDALERLLEKAADNEVETAFKLTVSVICEDGKAQITVSYDTVVTSGDKSVTVSSQSQKPFSCGASTIFSGVNIDSCCSKPKKKK